MELERRLSTTFWQLSNFSKLFLILTFSDRMSKRHVWQFGERQCVCSSRPCLHVQCFETQEINAGLYHAKAALWLLKAVVLIKRVVRGSSKEWSVGRRNLGRGFQKIWSALNAILILLQMFVYAHTQRMTMKYIWQ